MIRKMTLAALALCAVAAPALAQAQGYDGWYRPQPAYAPPGGDYDYGRRGYFTGYPEFRGIEQHIRDEIRQGIRTGDIEPDDARALFGQLRRIQDHERREFQVHGWSLPWDDRSSIRDDLRRLDHLVDETREAE